MDPVEYFIRKIKLSKASDESDLSLEISFDADSDFYAICLLGFFDFLNEQYHLLIEDCAECEFDANKHESVMDDFENFVDEIPEQLTDKEASFFKSFRKLLEVSQEKQSTLIFDL